MHTEAFIDNKGRQWRPRITARVLRDFELQTGASIFGAIIANTKADGSAVDDAGAGIAKELFANIDRIMRLTYLGCHVDGKPPKGDDGVEIGYDNFCDAVSPSQMSQALSVCMSALNEQMTDPNAAKGSSGGPFEGSPGEKSIA